MTPERLTNLERLREVVKAVKPDRLEAFDGLIHRQKAALHPDDDLFMLLEVIGFHTELTTDAPTRIESAIKALEELCDRAEEAGAISQNEASKILQLLASLAEELPARIDTAAIAERIGNTIQIEQIAPLQRAATQLAQATSGLHTAAERAEKAHATLNRAASIVPWAVSLAVCGLLATATSLYFINQANIKAASRSSAAIAALPVAFRTIADRGRTVDLIQKEDGSYQIVLTGAADTVFIAQDGRGVIEFR